MDDLHEKIIADWRDAYEAANGKSSGQRACRNGWYRTRWNAFRKSQLVAMTASLRARAPVAAQSEKGV